jgi:hypothetical protein
MVLDVTVPLSRFRRIGGERMPEDAPREEDSVGSREVTMTRNLTDVEKRIFDAVVKKYYPKKINEPFLIKILRLANVHGDGYKRIQRIGEDRVFLVPIEDIILHGVKAWELDKYTTELKGNEAHGIRRI